MTTTMVPVYGPQTEEIHAFFAAIRRLNRDDLRWLKIEPNTDVEQAVTVAMRHTEDSETWLRLVATGYQYIRYDPVKRQAWFGIRNALLALFVRDRLGHQGFTRAHYTRLAFPYVRATGTRLHSDDP